MNADRSDNGVDDFSLRLAWDEADGVRDEPGAPADLSPDRGSTSADPTARPGGVEAPGLAGLGRVVAELRDEVVELRQALLEQPDLAEVLDGVRRDVAGLLDVTQAAGRATPSHSTLAPLVAEVTSMREELVALRRRVALRAGGERYLDDTQLAQLADLVALRLSRTTSVTRP